MFKVNFEYFFFSPAFHFNQNSKIIKSKGRRKYVIFGFVFHQNRVSVKKVIKKNSSCGWLMMVGAIFWAYITRIQILCYPLEKTHLFFLDFYLNYCVFRMIVWIYFFFTFLLEIFLSSSFLFLIVIGEEKKGFFSELFIHL